MGGCSLSGTLTIFLRGRYFCDLSVSIYIVLKLLYTDEEEIKTESKISLVIAEQKCNVDPVCEYFPVLLLCGVKQINGLAGGRVWIIKYVLCVFCQIWSVLQFESLWRFLYLMMCILLCNWKIQKLILFFILILTHTASLLASEEEGVIDVVFHCFLCRCSCYSSLKLFCVMLLATTCWSLGSWLVFERKIQCLHENTGFVVHCRQSCSPHVRNFDAEQAI